MVLTNKVAIVTGSSRGIGRAIAQRLGRDGATVIVNYNKGKQEAGEVVTQIQTEGGQAVAIQADMSQLTEIRQLFQDTLDQFNRVDILVNNSGMGGKQEAIADVTSVMPGPTILGMFEWASPDFRTQAAASSPFNRIGQPVDIADVVAFLKSDDARWITGQHILVNGGATI